MQLMPDVTSLLPNPFQAKRFWVPFPGICSTFFTSMDMLDLFTYRILIYSKSKDTSECAESIRELASNDHLSTAGYPGLIVYHQLRKS